MGRKIKGFSPQAKQALTAYDWPGNIRELKNVIERGLILTPGDEVGVDALGLTLRMWWCRSLRVSQAEMP